MRLQFKFGHRELVDKVGQPEQVGEAGGRLRVPLGVRVDDLAPLFARKQPSSVLR